MKSPTEEAVQVFLKLARPQLELSAPDWKTASLPALALDSLDQTTLCLDIEDATGVELRVEDLSEIATLGDLISFVESKAGAK